MKHKEEERDRQRQTVMNPYLECLQSQFQFPGLAYNCLQMFSLDLVSYLSQINKFLFFVVVVFSSSGVGGGGGNGFLVNLRELQLI